MDLECGEDGEDCEGLNLVNGLPLFQDMVDNWLQECEDWFRKGQCQSYGQGCEDMILEPVRKLLDGHIPAKLYKLQSPEDYAIDYLKHPDEFKESLIKDNIRQTQELQQEISAQTFVSCFTTQISNMLMWSHYAKSHSGFALGFDFNNPVIASAKKMLYPVFYSDKKIDVTVEMVFVQQMSMVGDRNYSIDKLIGIKSSLFKSPDWAYEHEWRVVKRDLENTDRYGSIPLRASEIYYGCKIEPSVFERLHQIAISQGLREYRMEADVFSPSYDLKALAM